jgi:hypothetical protein
MNQSLTFDLNETLQTVADLGLFVSLCIITRRANPPTVDAGGWPDYSYSTTVHSSIPCMFAVEAQAKPDKYGVARTQINFQEVAYYHVLLNGSFMDILQRDLATVDGTVYEVMAVEGDSQGVMTRLGVRRWKQ